MNENCEALIKRLCNYSFKEKYHFNVSFHYEKLEKLCVKCRLLSDVKGIPSFEGSWMDTPDKAMDSVMQLVEQYETVKNIEGFQLIKVEKYRERKTFGEYIVSFRAYKGDTYIESIDKIDENEFYYCESISNIKDRKDVYEIIDEFYYTKTGHKNKTKIDWFDFDRMDEWNKIKNSIKTGERLMVFDNIVPMAGSAGLLVVDDSDNIIKSKGYLMS
jgi:hypothetical protein